MSRKSGLELVDDIGHHAPDMDVFAFSNVKFGIVGILGRKKHSTFTAHKTLHGQLSVQRGDDHAVVSGSDMALVRELLGGKADTLDAFDVPQLACVIRLCRSSSTLSEAGRRLFAASRLTKATSNDADRLRKYLARFGLDWRGVKGR